jgi:hypothetical protein
MPCSKRVGTRKSPASVCSRQLKTLDKRALTGKYLLNGHPTRNSNLGRVGSTFLGSVIYLTNKDSSKCAFINHNNFNQNTAVDRSQRSNIKHTTVSPEICKIGKVQVAFNMLAVNP